MEVAVLTTCFCIWGVAFIICSFFLIQKRKIKFFQVRSVVLVVLSNLYGLLSSIVVGISIYNPDLCLANGILYSLLLPVASGPIILAFPDLLLRSILNAEKTNRANGIIDYRWRLMPFCRPSVKIFIIVVTAFIQTGIYLALYYTVEIDGDCQKLPIFVFDGAMVVVFSPYIFIWRQIITMSDPYHFKNQLVVTSTLSAPSIVLTILYPFVPFFEFQYVFLTSNVLMFLCSMVGILIFYHFWFHEEILSHTDHFEGISTIFSDENKYQLIYEFAEKTWSQESILFYNAIADFHSHGADANKARTIAAEYIGNSAPMQVNIEEQTAKTILEKIAANNIQKDIFDAALNEITVIIKADIIFRYEKNQRS